MCGCGMTAVACVVRAAIDVMARCSAVAVSVRGRVIRIHGFLGWLHYTALQYTFRDVSKPRGPGQGPTLSLDATRAPQLNI